VTVSLKDHLSRVGDSILKGFLGFGVAVGTTYSCDEERELRERIKALVQEEKAIRNERHVLEARLRALVMTRFRELCWRFGIHEP